MGVAAFSVSQHGSLAYQARTGGALLELVWYDRQGARVDQLTEGGPYSALALAPDQSQAVVVEEDLQHADANLWLFNVETGVRRRLTVNPALDRSPVWSHDGKRIYYTSRRDSRTSIYVKEIDGASDEVLFYQGTHDLMAMAPSPDGRFLTIASLGDQGSDLLLLPLEGAREPRPLVASQFDEWGGAFSPDGRWIVYSSDESADAQVYVQPFPALDRRWQVSVEGGFAPHWRGDGGEIFFLSYGKVMSATVGTRGGDFEVERLRPLFEIPRLTPADLFYDVAADGERFLFPAVAATAREPIVLVFDWTMELDAR
jgi:Tol biopolymer transport system component